MKCKSNKIESARWRFSNHRIDGYKLHILDREYNILSDRPRSGELFSKTELEWKLQNDGIERYIKEVLNK